MKRIIERVAVKGDLYQILEALKTNRKKRSELGEIFVEGIESIKQADRAGVSVSRALCADAAGLSDWAKDFLNRHAEASVIELTNGLYAELSDRDEPSELMITARFKRLFLNDVSLPDKPLILIFDRPSDHGNLGSIVRSANAFGADCVVITGHAVDSRDPKVIRSSLGAVFRTPVIQAESFEELDAWLSGLRARTGLRVAGTDSTGAIPLHKANLNRPLALILGNEAKGMSVRLKTLVDEMVSIPMRGEVNSLNVACAATALLWQVHSNSLGNS